MNISIKYIFSVLLGEKAETNRYVGIWISNPTDIFALDIPN